MILEKMLVLLIIMVIGFIAYKQNMITDEVSKKLSSIIVNIANPAIILSSVAGSDLKDIPKNDLVITFVAAISMYAILMVLAEIIVRVHRIPNEKKGMYRVMTIFSNIGYMGYPVIQSVYGSGALVYASVFLIPFNILIYTYGIIAMKSNKDKKEKLKVRTVMNNGVIACIFMLIILVFNVKLPAIISDTIISVSGMVVPISMMIIGASLATINFKDLLRDIHLLVFSAIRLIAIPVAGTFIANVFINNETLLGVILVMLATPIGSLTAMLANEYGGDVNLASKGIALTTILSVGTLPLAFAITGI